MGQLLLELGDISEPLSSSPRLYAMDRQHLDPEARSSLLADTLCRLPLTTGVGLRRADGAGLTWKYVNAVDKIPFLPPPSKRPAIENTMPIIYKGLQF